MPSKILEKVADHISTHLPSDASIVAEVINTIHNPGSNASDIAEIIEHDPAIAANILKIANSACYGSTVTISSVRRAVVILGFSYIKELVLTITLRHYFFDPDLPEEVDRAGLWLHSVGTAHASKLIAQHMNICRPDIAYTAGLLHDIGKVLLITFFSKRYCKVIKQAIETNSNIILMERKILKTDHTQVGKVLCDAWEFPEDITVAISAHHIPMETEEENRMLACIVHLGNFMCRTARIGNPGDEVITQASKDALGILGSRHEVISDNFNTILANLEELQSDILDFFNNLDKDDMAQVG